MLLQGASAAVRFGGCVAFVLAMAGLLRGQEVSPADVLAELRIRGENASRLAAQFNYRLTANGQTLQRQGVAAVSGRHFMLKSESTSVSSVGANSASRLWYAGDATQFQKLANQVKQVQPIVSAQAKYVEGVRSLISNPLYAVTNQGLKPSRGQDFFRAEEVRKCFTDASGKVIVEVDGSKRSDFDVIVYEFSPSLSWALTRAEFRSGDQTVATLEAGEFFVPPGSKIHVPGKVTYKRPNVPASDLGTLTELEMRLQSSPGLRLEDDATFRLDFPADAMTLAEAQAKSELVAGGKAILNETLTQSVSKLSETPPAALGPVTRPASDRPLPPALQPAAVATESHRPILAAAVVPVLVILLCGIAVLAMLRRKSHRNQLLFSRSSLALLAAIGVATVVGLGINHFNAVQAVSEEMASPSQGAPWPCELSDVPYEGYVVNGGKQLSYRGRLTRLAGLETHRWQEGQQQVALEFHSDMFQKYVEAGTTRKLLFSQMSPMLYPLIYAYREQAHEACDLSTGNPRRLDLSATQVRSLGGSPVKECHVQVTPGAAGATVVAVYYSGQLTLRATLVKDRETGKAKEIYEYFDAHGSAVFEMGFTCQLP